MKQGFPETFFFVQILCKNSHSLMQLTVKLIFSDACAVCVVVTYSTYWKQGEHHNHTFCRVVIVDNQYEAPTSVIAITVS